MPEKSGMDAALRGPALACPVAGPSCCPQAGLAAAANVTNKSKVRCTFMSTSPHELLGLPRPRLGAEQSISYPRCEHRARGPRRLPKWGPAAHLAGVSGAVARVE